ncbi:gamma-interferon-inducible protein 16-like [Arvicola amphibius]|uniref:gamma-interferon-inducible protein 16-like n=1 Tax=Arvicola amphibius TaxID=1047088 RepID=UPI0018E2C2DC|nr:gamma-interferon-inducible protein 16-like [Arvicola amphibius]
MSAYIYFHLLGLSIILGIMSEYKRIILLNGLECMEDNHFRMIKSILRKKLNLSKKMQDDYDRIQIADQMEDTFPKDAGLDELIDVCQSIKELEGLAKTLKAEKAKVQKQKKGKNKTALGKRKQDAPSSSQSLSTGNESNKNKPPSKKKRKMPTKIEDGKKRKLTQEQTQLPEPSGSYILKDEGCLQTSHSPPPTPLSSSSNKTPRTGNIPAEPAKEEGYHQESKEVMVLKVTEPFTYDLIDDKRMFHATVATENEFFRVKIFDPVLKNKFIPNKIIAISNYFGLNGFLEIHEASCVSDVDMNRTMAISKTLRQRANATPKIRDLFSQAQGTYVNGEFVVYKKTERNPFIYYGIEDDTGNMEVVVYGRLTSIKCEPGQKLRLVCFELSSSKDTWQLKSVRHSNMQSTEILLCYQQTAQHHCVNLEKLSSQVLSIILGIMSEYKKIVLLKGLERMEDYHFRIIRSLLRKGLHLSERMQNDYDRIQIADLMEETFPKDAGLGKLIGFCQENKDLKHLVEDLKAEKAKVEKQKKRKKTTAGEGKQGEPSGSHTLSSSNAPSSEEKQTAETESGKKRKLTQEQTQLLEPPGSNTQKDEGCLQTSQKPPTSSSNSSNKKQKTTNTKKQSTLKTDDSQTKHQLLGLSATSNSSAAWEGQTLLGLAATASSSFHTPQTPPETCDSLKTSQDSPSPPCQSFPISPVSDSSIHLNSPVTLTLSNDVQTPYVPSATASNNVWVPSVPSERMSSSLSAPQMSPVSGSISAQNLHLLTTAAFNSMQILHNPQTVASRSAQTPRVPATLKSKAQVIKTPLAAASSSVQVPHALPGAVSRNVSTTQVPQRTTGSSIQTLNPARVNVPRNAQVPGPLATVPAYFLTSLPSPATASSSVQVLPLTTSNSLPDPRVPRPIATSRIQTTQMHPAAVSSFIQAPHAPPLTVSRSVCPTQVPQGAASSTGQTLPCPKVKAPTCALAPQMPSATTSESLLAQCTSLPKASQSLLAPMGSPATTSSSSCRTPRMGNIPKEPAKKEGYHREPKEVMVLKVTEPFTYDLINDKRMFHATVATENEFFRVKIFDPVLKNKFIPNKIIVISNYFGSNGFLEIHEASCVSDVDMNRTMAISKTLRKRANATPKIRDLFSQAQGTYVNGEFVVYKKTERNSCICYGIEDDTGIMEVEVNGKLTSIKCEPGQKLRLVCFELSSSENKWQLKSVEHSNMQVVNVRKKVPQA